jgi:BMFP domain-containing protein YqiC
MVKTFETPERLSQITASIKKANLAQFQAAIRGRDEAQAKLQALEARMASFAEQMKAVEGEIAGLKLKFSQELAAGGGPAEINKSWQLKNQELADLGDWIEQLKNTAIPEAQKAVKEAETPLRDAIKQAYKKIQTTFEEELAGYLTQASDLFDSFWLAVAGFYRDLGVKNPPPNPSLALKFDHDKTRFIILRFPGH